MSWIEGLILGIVQGLTEFLPVSSSGHIVIGSAIFGIQAEENLTFAILVHAATVLSTIVILWHEIAHLFKGTFFTYKWNEEKSYVSKIFVSMIPIFIVGIFFKDTVEQFFGEGLLVVGCCLITTSLLLAFAYYAKPRQKEHIGFLDAFIIGIAQAIAVLPGLSRSGSTIATGLLLGNKKESVAKFSFLMVLIPILGEALLETIDLIKEGGLVGESWLPLIMGFIGAFIAGCFACKFMIELVKRGKLIYFAIYCFIVGGITLTFAFL